MIQGGPDAVELKIISKLMRIKKRYYNLINTINVKKHLKGIQAEADATCEKSILIVLVVNSHCASIYIVLVEN